MDARLRSLLSPCTTVELHCVIHRRLTPISTRRGWSSFARRPLDDPNRNAAVGFLNSVIQEVGQPLFDGIQSQGEKMRELQNQLDPVKIETEPD